MILRRGELNNLTGNAIVYWEVIGENNIAPGFKVFAINFTVSSLPLDNKLLTATFPPIPFKDLNELTHKLTNVYCDIIYGGELNFPVDQETFSQFYKNEFAKFNKIIEEYVEIYKEKFNFTITQLSEKEKLKLLKDLTDRIRIDIREGGKSKKLFTNRINQLMNNLRNDEKYEVNRLKDVLFLPGDVADQLVNLYTSKFLAIHDENYEIAIHLKQEITKLEQDIHHE